MALSFPEISKLFSYTATGKVRRGTWSAETREVQKLLKKGGYFPASVPATGYYGKITAEAFSKFLSSPTYKAYKEWKTRQKKIVKERKEVEKLRVTFEDLFRKAPSLRGKRSKEIAAFQDLLKKHGFFPRYVRSTGYWGPITQRAYERALSHFRKKKEAYETERQKQLRLQKLSEEIARRRAEEERKRREAEERRRREEEERRRREAERRRLEEARRKAEEARRRAEEERRRREEERRRREEEKRRKEEERQRGIWEAINSAFGRFTNWGRAIRTKIREELNKLGKELVRKGFQPPSPEEVARNVEQKIEREVIDPFISKVRQQANRVVPSLREEVRKRAERLGREMVRKGITIPSPEEVVEKAKKQVEREVVNPLIEKAKQIAKVPEVLREIARRKAEEVGRKLVERGVRIPTPEEVARETEKSIKTEIINPLIEKSKSLVSKSIPPSLKELARRKAEEIGRRMVEKGVRIPTPKEVAEETQKTIEREVIRPIIEKSKEFAKVPSPLRKWMEKRAEETGKKLIRTALKLPTPEEIKKKVLREKERLIETLLRKTEPLLRETKKVTETLLFSKTSREIQKKIVSGIKETVKGVTEGFPILLERGLLLVSQANLAAAKNLTNLNPFLSKEQKERISELIDKKILDLMEKEGKETFYGIGDFWREFSNSTRFLISSEIGLGKSTEEFLKEPIFVRKLSVFEKEQRRRILEKAKEKHRKKEVEKWLNEWQEKFEKDPKKAEEELQKEFDRYGLKTVREEIRTIEREIEKEKEKIKTNSNALSQVSKELTELQKEVGKDPLLQEMIELQKEIDKTQDQILNLLNEQNLKALRTFSNPEILKQDISEIKKQIEKTQLAPIEKEIAEINDFLSQNRSLSQEFERRRTRIEENRQKIEKLISNPVLSEFYSLLSKEKPTEKEKQRIGEILNKHKEAGTILELLEIINKDANWIKEHKNEILALGKSLKKLNELQEKHKEALNKATEYLKEALRKKGIEVKKHLPEISKLYSLIRKRDELIRKLIAIKPLLTKKFQNKEKLFNQLRTRYFGYLKILQDSVRRINQLIKKKQKLLSEGLGTIAGKRIFEITAKEKIKAIRERREEINNLLKSNWKLFASEAIKRIFPTFLGATSASAIAGGIATVLGVSGPPGWLVAGIGGLLGWFASKEVSDLFMKKLPNVGRAFLATLYDFEESQGIRISSKKDLETVEEHFKKLPIGEKLSAINFFANSEISKKGWKELSSFEKFKTYLKAFNATEAEIIDAFKKEHKEIIEKAPISKELINFLPWIITDPVTYTNPAKIVWKKTGKRLVSETQRWIAGTRLGEVMPKLAKKVRESKLGMAAIELDNLFRFKPLDIEHIYKLKETPFAEIAKALDKDVRLTIFSNVLRRELPLANKIAFSEIERQLREVPALVDQTIKGWWKNLSKKDQKVVENFTRLLVGLDKELRYQPEEYIENPVIRKFFKPEVLFKNKELFETALKQFSAKGKAKETLKRKAEELTREYEKTVAESITRAFKGERKLNNVELNSRLREFTEREKRIIKNLGKDTVERSERLTILKTIADQVERLNKGEIKVWEFKKYLKEIKNREPKVYNAWMEYQKLWKDIHKLAEEKGFLLKELPDFVFVKDSKIKGIRLEGVLRDEKVLIKKYDEFLTVLDKFLKRKAEIKELTRKLKKLKKGTKDYERLLRRIEKEKAEIAERERGIRFLQSSLKERIKSEHKPLVIRYNPNSVGDSNELIFQSLFKGNYKFVNDFLKIPIGSVLGTERGLSNSFSFTLRDFIISELKQQEAQKTKLGLLIKDLKEIFKPLEKETKDEVPYFIQTSFRKTKGTEELLKEIKHSGIDKKFPHFEVLLRFEKDPTFELKPLSQVDTVEAMKSSFIYVRAIGKQKLIDSNIYDLILSFLLTVKALTKPHNKNVFEAIIRDVLEGRRIWKGENKEIFFKALKRVAEERSLPLEQLKILKSLFFEKHPWAEMLELESSKELDQLVNLVSSRISSLQKLLLEKKPEIKKRFIKLTEEFAYKGNLIEFSELPDIALRFCQIRVLDVDKSQLRSAILKTVKLLESYASLRPAKVPLVFPKRAVYWPMRFPKKEMERYFKEKLEATWEVLAERLKSEFKERKPLTVDIIKRIETKSLNLKGKTVTYLFPREILSKEIEMGVDISRYIPEETKKLISHPYFYLFKDPNCISRKIKHWKEIRNFEFTVINNYRKLLGKLKKKKKFIGGFRIITPDAVFFSEIKKKNEKEILYQLAKNNFLLFKLHPLYPSLKELIEPLKLSEKEIRDLLFTLLETERLKLKGVTEEEIALRWRAAIQEVIFKGPKWRRRLAESKGILVPLRKQEITKDISFEKLKAQQKQGKLVGATYPSEVSKAIREGNLKKLSELKLLSLEEAALSKRFFEEGRIEKIKGVDPNFFGDTYTLFKTIADNTGITSLVRSLDDIKKASSVDLALEIYCLSESFGKVMGEINPLLTEFQKKRKEVIKKLEKETLEKVEKVKGFRLDEKLKRLSSLFGFDLAENYGLKPSDVFNSIRIYREQLEKVRKIKEELESLIRSREELIRRLREGKKVEKQLEKIKGEIERRELGLSVLTSFFKNINSPEFINNLPYLFLEGELIPEFGKIRQGFENLFAPLVKNETFKVVRNLIYDFNPEKDVLVGGEKKVYLDKLLEREITFTENQLKKLENKRFLEEFVEDLGKRALEAEWKIQSSKGLAKKINELSFKILDRDYKELKAVLRNEKKLGETLYVRRRTREIRFLRDLRDFINKLYFVSLTEDGRRFLQKNLTLENLYNVYKGNLEGKKFLELFNYHLNQALKLNSSVELVREIKLPGLNWKEITRKELDKDLNIISTTRYYLPDLSEGILLKTKPQFKRERGALVVKGFERTIGRIKIVETGRITSADRFYRSLIDPIYDEEVKKILKAKIRILQGKNVYLKLPRKPGMDDRAYKKAVKDWEEKINRILFEKYFHPNELKTLQEIDNFAKELKVKGISWIRGLKPAFPIPESPGIPIEPGRAVKTFIERLRYSFSLNEELERMEKSGFIEKAVELVDELKPDVVVFVTDPKMKRVPSFVIPSLDAIREQGNRLFILAEKPRPIDREIAKITKGFVPIRFSELKEKLKRGDPVFFLKIGKGKSPSLERLKKEFPHLKSDFFKFRTQSEFREYIRDITLRTIRDSVECISEGPFGAPPSFLLNSLLLGKISTREFYQRWLGQFFSKQIMRKAEKIFERAHRITREALKKQGWSEERITREMANIIALEQKILTYVFKSSVNLISGFPLFVDKIVDRLKKHLKIRDKQLLKQKLYALSSDISLQYKLEPVVENLKQGKKRFYEELLEFGKEKKIPEGEIKELFSSIESELETWMVASSGKTAPRRTFEELEEKICEKILEEVPVGFGPRAQKEFWKIFAKTYATVGKTLSFIKKSYWGLTSLWIAWVLYYRLGWHVRNLAGDLERATWSGISLSNFLKTLDLHEAVFARFIPKVLSDWERLKLRETARVLLVQRKWEKLKPVLKKMGIEFWKEGESMKEKIKRLSEEISRYKPIREWEEYLPESLKKWYSELGIRRVRGLIEPEEFEDVKKFAMSGGLSGLFEDPGNVGARMKMLIRNGWLPKSTKEVLPEKLRKPFETLAKDLGFLKLFNHEVQLFSVFLEEARRLILFDSLLAKRGYDIAKAAMETKKYLFDYSDMNLVFRSLRRLFPFLAFNVKNLELFAREIPQRYGLKVYGAYYYLFKALEEAEKEGNLPEWARLVPRVRIPGTDLWIGLPFSVFDVLDLFFKPDEVARKFIHNPLHLFAGLGWHPAISSAIETATGKDFWDFETEYKERGYSDEEIERLEIYKKERKEAKKWWQKPWLSILQSVPFAPVFFKLQDSFRRTTLEDLSIFKNPSFREFLKGLGLNILEWDDWAIASQFYFSIPHDIYYDFAKRIRKRDPFVWEIYDWIDKRMKEALIRDPQLLEKLHRVATRRTIYKILTEKDPIKRQKLWKQYQQRFIVNLYFRLEEEEKGAGARFLEKHPELKKEFEDYFKNSFSPFAVRRHIFVQNQKLRSIVYEILKKLPKGTKREQKEKHLRYNALGIDIPWPIFDYDQLYYELFDSEGNLKILSKEQLEILLERYKLPESLLKDAERNAEQNYHDYLMMSRLEKQRKREADARYSIKLAGFFSFFPSDFALLPKEEKRRIYEKALRYLDQVLTKEEKARWERGKAAYNKEFERRIKKYLELWEKLIREMERTGGYDYYERFYQMPSWFISYYFFNHPLKRLYYPFKRELLRRFKKDNENRKRGIFTNFALRWWFNPKNKKAKEAFAKDQPESFAYLDWVMNWIREASRDEWDAWRNIFWSGKYNKQRETYFKRHPEKKRYYEWIQKWVSFASKEDWEGWKKVFWDSKYKKQRETYFSHYPQKKKYYEKWAELIKIIKTKEFEDYVRAFLSTEGWFRKLYLKKDPAIRSLRIEYYKRFIELLDQGKVDETFDLFWEDRFKELREDLKRRKPEEYNYLLFWRRLSLLAEKENWEGWRNEFFAERNKKYRERYYKRHPEKKRYYEWLGRWINFAFKGDWKNWKRVFYDSSYKKEREMYFKTHPEKEEYYKTWNKLLKKENFIEFIEAFLKTSPMFKKTYLKKDPYLRGLKIQYYEEFYKLFKEGKIDERFKLFWKPEFKPLREELKKKDPDTYNYLLFWKRLSALARIENWDLWQAYFWRKDNKKYRERFFEKHPEKKQLYLDRMEYFSLPKETFEDNLKRFLFLEEHPELRESFKEDLEPKRREAYEKYYQYQKLLLEAPDVKSKPDRKSLESLRRFYLMRERFREENIEIFRYLKKEEGVKTTLERMIEHYFSLGTLEERKNYLKENPELKEYFRKKQHPLFSKLIDLQEEYFRKETLGEREEFLNKHPELLDFWEIWALPRSYFFDRKRFKPWEKRVNEVREILQKEPCELLSRLVSKKLFKEFWKVPETDEGYWFKEKIYRMLMENWIRLAKENPLFGVLYFRSLPDWAKSKYLTVHPEKSYLVKYPLRRFIEEGERIEMRFQPDLRWALEKISKFGRYNLPSDVEERVRRIFKKYKIWRDKGNWNKADWERYFEQRMIAINRLKEKDLERLPLLKKELDRAIKELAFLEGRSFKKPLIGYIGSFY